MTSKPMPVIQCYMDKIPEQYHDLVQKCIGQGGRLRSTKPVDGRAAYVWRMIAFQISPNPAHHCIPCTADFGIESKHYQHRTEKYQLKGEDPGWDQRTWDRMNDGARREVYIREELVPIVDAVVNALPKSQWHGIQRWHKAFYG